MKRLFALLVIIGILFPAAPFAKAAESSQIWDGSIASDFASGTGTAQDPFVIETPAQLAYLSESVNSGKTYRDQYIVLASDIYLNDVSSANWTANATKWDSIGYCNTMQEGSDRSFQGSFDGGGHTILGLSLNYHYESSGFFGYIGFNGIVKNLKIDESEITGNLALGAIAGYCEGTIQYCANLGHVFSNASCVGGIVGMAHPRAIIEYCYNGGQIEGHSDVGGISGSDGTIRNCYNYGAVSGKERIGGICGTTYSLSSLEYCYSIGTVTGSYHSVGGHCW